MFLLLPLGAIVGLLLGGLLAVIIALLAGITPAGLGFLGAIASGTPIPGILSTFTIALGPNTPLLMALVLLFILTTGPYALANIALLAPIAAASPPAPAVSTALPAVPLELFCRGMLIGISAAVNFAVWSIPLTSPGVGATLATLTLLAAIPTVSALPAYQFLIGWTNWFLPMSTLLFVLPLGFLLFIIAAPGAIGSPGGGVRFDVRTCTIETTGGPVIAFLGAIAPTGFGGFNMGNFTFLAAGSSGSFVTPSVSSHETGHTLNLAIAGGAFHWLNAIDENLIGRLDTTLAYGELCAESHAARTGLLLVRVWR